MLAKGHFGATSLTRRGAMGLAAAALVPVRAQAQAQVQAQSQAQTPAGGRVGGGAVLVMNSGAASLSVIDMATRRETRRIPVLREPHHWTLTPDRKELLIGDSSGNELLVLDPVNFAVLRRMPLSNPYHLAFSPNGKHFVVAGLARNQIDIYEAATYTLLKRFPMRSMPSHMAFSADSSVVFMSLQGTGRIVAIDLRALEVVWNAECGSAPAGVLVHGGQVLAGNMGSDDVAVLDAHTGKVMRRIRTGKGAHTMWLAADRKTIWVNSRLDPVSVVVLDAATLEPLRRYRLPGGPDDLEFAPDGRVWFTMRFIHKVAVLDPGSDDLTIIDVGRSPHGIFLNPKGIATA